MKKSLLFTAIAVASSQPMAAAYKIPEQSVNSTALAGAYIANANGADANYYNPAAMALNEDGASIEGDLTFIHLTSISVDNHTTGMPDDETKKENFIVPTFHYISPIVNDARFGLSVIAPAGLSKRWKGVNRAFAEEFTLKTIEINPAMGYKINDQVSIGAGFRIVYSEGVVKSRGDQLGSLPVGRDMEGDSWDMGLNLALHYRPTDELNLAVTYRTKIDLTVEGDAKLTSPVIPVGYDGGASVTIPIPAALNLAAAYTFNDRTTVELVYERTYWSAYDELDFNYDTALPHPAYTVAFDDPKIKDWNNTNTYRIGVTHRLNSRWTLMGGFAYDETPVPEKYAGYELPDSDAQIYSLGARYQYSDDLNIGFGLLYDKKDKLTLDPGENLEAGGSLSGGAKFEDASAYLFTVGLNYKF